MPKWTFIRHGEAQSNAEGWVAGHRDAPLTRTGQNQAKALLHDLAHVHVDRVVSSDLQRATDTARLMLGGRLIPWEQTPALRERNCGVFEGQPIAELRAAGHM